MVEINDKIITLMKEFNAVDVFTIEEFLEILQDWDMLSEKGLKFRKEIWELFIKKEEVE